MRDDLPPHPLKKECAIMNLDKSENAGTHWVAFAKLDNYVEYYDSYGNLKPPEELIKYIGPNIFYNYDNDQKHNTYKCGHLCLKFLNAFWNLNKY